MGSFIFSLGTFLPNPVRFALSLVFAHYGVKVFSCMDFAEVESHHTEPKSANIYYLEGNWENGKDRKGNSEGSR